MGCAGFRQHMKINYRWVLEWPSMEPGFEDKQEIESIFLWVTFPDETGRSPILPGAGFISLVNRRNRNSTGG